MSTRSTVIIKDTYETLYFYRHSDGYPEHTGEDLEEFVKGYTRGEMRRSAQQSAGWLIIRGCEEYKKDGIAGQSWKVGAYEPTSAISADCEFVYLIDLVEGRLKIIAGNMISGRVVNELKF